MGVIGVLLILAYIGSSGTGVSGLATGTGLVTAQPRVPYHILGNSYVPQGPRAMIAMATPQSHDMMIMGKPQSRVLYHMPGNSYAPLGPRGAIASWRNEKI